MRQITVPTLAVAVLTFGACVGAEPASEPIEVDDGPYYRTVVRFNTDGTQKVTHHEITREQQAADIAARRELERRRAAGESVPLQQAITQDGSCGGSSMWIYSNISLGGFEICFLGTGTADLRDYQLNPFCSYPANCARWATTSSSRVRSFSSGTNAGMFQSTMLTGDMGYAACQAYGIFENDYDVNFGTSNCALLTQY